MRFEAGKLFFPQTSSKHWQTAARYGCLKSFLRLSNLSRRKVVGDSVIKESNMVWNYALPTACFLIYGALFKGTVEGATKSEARNALKRKLEKAFPKAKIKLPEGTVLAKKGFWWQV